MSYIETSPIQNSTILRIYSEREEIETSPQYQRAGGIWTLEKKNLLIDSILNDYDIPKIYFHQFSRDEKNETGKSYAIIDGKQRIEAIWGFIEGKFCLDGDFEYQDKPELKLGGLTYNELANDYPRIKIKFDSFVLPIVGVRTDDFDLIEDMFSRLNEAAPLNSAEKRNAIGGNMVKAIRELSNHDFFIHKVKFNNNRYQHHEIIARFLLVEHSYSSSEKLIDTKKIFLDLMVKQFKKDNCHEVLRLTNLVKLQLKKMSTCFLEKDSLLKTQGSMVVYYLLFREADRNYKEISRSSLIEFEKKVKDNRVLAEERYEDASFDLLEFDRLSQAGTNDVSNIRDRVMILKEYLFNNDKNNPI